MALLTVFLNSSRGLHPLCSALLVLALAACSTPRVDPPPPPATPTAFKQDGVWKRSTPLAAPPVDERWWTVYQDPVLDRLQSQLVIGNENLKAAVAQVEAARAVLGAGIAAQRPALGASLSANRADSGGAASPRNEVSSGLNATWEIDLWGRLREATRGNQARLDASVADLAAARMSAQSALARSYFALRTAEVQQSILGRSIEGLKRSLELTQARYDAGVTAQSDVLQAQTQLKSAQVQALEAGTQRAQFEHAIAVLLGQSPSALALPAAPEAADLPTPPGVPELLPSTLLQRRPDVAAAERRMAAAYAQIGVADAAFFPSLVLSANAGQRGSNLDQLFNAPALFWSLGPALAQRLFDGGARQAGTDQAHAEAERSTAVYRQTVLQAFQDVEDNLVLSDRLQAQVDLQREALRHAQRNLEITQEQYRVGTVSYLNVVTAQTTALNSERTLLDLRARQLNAVNELLKNVAGRW